MSPNLSSHHFPPNRMLYEQVIYNLFKIVGVAPPRPIVESNANRTADLLARQREGSFKDLAVFPEQCGLCRLKCDQVECRLCQPCMNSTTEDILWDVSDFLHGANIQQHILDLGRSLFTGLS